MSGRGRREEKKRGANFFILFSIPFFLFFFLFFLFFIPLFSLPQYFSFSSLNVKRWLIMPYCIFLVAPC